MEKREIKILTQELGGIAVNRFKVGEIVNDFSISGIKSSLAENDIGFKKMYRETPVLVEDCQSRSDFIVYNGELYLFHVPIDREHIGIIHVDTENIKNSTVVLAAHMHTSCFYPFIQYFKDGELAMSYTVERKHIRLAPFNLKNYICP